MNCLLNLAAFVTPDRKDRILNYKSWGQRAWCRTESLARELCPAHDNLMIRVESSRPKDQTNIGA